MPLGAEFEEKQFEEPLNIQLLAGSKRLFPSGQVLEALVGFDAAMHAQAAVFWKLWGRTSPPKGTGIDWGWWKKKEGKPFPAWKFNLLVQYKRPEYLSGSLAGQWKKWKKPYYRYEITPHQHAALRAASNGFGKQGLVVYASPGFRTLVALGDHILGGTLVQNTNFVEARTIQKTHSHYTYGEPGKSGWACSEPEEVPPIPDLLATVERICADKDVPGLDSRKFLHGTREVLDNAAGRAADGFGGDPAFLVRATEQVLEYVVTTGPSFLADALPRYEEHLRAYVHVNVLCWAGKMEWIVAGTESASEETSTVRDGEPVFLR